VATRRGLGLVLTILLLAVLVSAAAMVVLMLAVGREPAVPSNAVLVVRVEGDLADAASDTVFASVIGARRNGTRAIVENLRKAKADRRISAVIVRPVGLSSAYWARLQEVRDAILDFKSSGKPTVAHLEYGGDREYFVATACDRVFLLPTSPLDVSGFASYELFLRGTLDKVGAYPDFLHIGDFKTAPNQFTRRRSHRPIARWPSRSTGPVRAIRAGRGRRPQEDAGPGAPARRRRALPRGGRGPRRPCRRCGLRRPGGREGQAWRQGRRAGQGRRVREGPRSLGRPGRPVPHRRHSTPTA